MSLITAVARSPHGPPLLGGPAATDVAVTDQRATRASGVDPKRILLIARNSSNTFRPCRFVGWPERDVSQLLLAIRHCMLPDDNIGPL